MEIKLSRKYFIGKSKPGQWVSVYAYKPHNADIFDRRGEIFAVISLKGPKDFDVSTAGNLILDHFHETYFENSRDSILIALEKAVLSTHKRLVTLIENNVSAMQEGVELDLLTMVISESFVYFVSMGKARVQVLRDGNVVDLTTFLKDPTGEGLINVGSGEMLENDKFLLLTPETVDEYTEDELLEAMAKFSETDLRNKLLEDESKIGLMMIKSGDAPDEEFPEDVEVLENMEVQEEPDGKYTKAERENLDLDFTEEVEERMDLAEDEIGEKSNESDEEEMEHDIEDGVEDGMEEHKPEVQRPKLRTFSEQTLGNNIQVKAKEVWEKIEEKIKQTIEKIKSKSENKAESGMPHEPRVETLTGHKSPITPNASDPTYLYFLKTVASKVYVVLAQVKRTVWNNWLGFGSDKIYLKGGGGRKNWMGILVLIVVVGIVLYLIINGQIQESRRKDNLNQAQALIESSQKIIDGVEDRITIALNSPIDDATRLSINKELDNALKELDEAAKFEVLPDEIAKEREAIEGLRNKLNRVVEVSLEEVVDLAEHYEDVEIYDFDYYSGNLYISDKKRNTIYKVAGTGGNPEEFISSGAGLTGPKSISIDQSGALIVNDSSEDKVIATVSLETRAVTKHTGLSLSKMGTITQIETYKVENSERIYGVRQENKDIVYYEKSGSGYSFPFSRGKSDNFATAMDTAVDGRVYVLAKGSGLTRYLSTKVDPVAIEGLAVGDTINNSVAMDIDATRIFFADPDNRRVVLFTKSRGENAGIYDLIIQIKSTDDSDFASLKEVVVDQKSNTLFILDGSKIFKVDLSQFKDFEPKAQ